MAAPLVESPQHREDLWCVGKEDMGGVGSEEALALWREACGMLDGLVDMAESQQNTALYVALSDSRARAYEEVRRHEAEVKMRRDWAEMVESGRAG